ncbi:hypothetical protein SRIMM317S_06631 [Streptomyces rimosus subsp. rimosus]
MKRGAPVSSCSFFSLRSASSMVCRGIPRRSAMAGTPSMAFTLAACRLTSAAALRVSRRPSSLPVPGR